MGAYLGGEAEECCSSLEGVEKKRGNCELGMFCAGLKKEINHACRNLPTACSS